MRDSRPPAQYEISRIEPVERFVVEGIPPGQGSWRRIMEGIETAPQRVRRAVSTRVGQRRHVVCVLESVQVHRLRQRLRERAKRFGAVAVHEERELTELRVWCPAGLSSLATRCVRALERRSIEVRESWIVEAALGIVVARADGQAALLVCHEQAEQWLGADRAPA